LNDIVGQGSTEGIHVPTEQERLDSIKHALEKLPNSELERYDINLNQSFLVGTEAAEFLKVAWAKRQSEIKKAIESQLKPAEYMRNISNILETAESDPDAASKSLVILESLLEDIDNARDFHTIGGWPVLAGLLSSPIPTHRSLSAWCIGSAIKNQYDYQLWVLEPISISLPGTSETVVGNMTSSALELLLGSLRDESLVLQRELRDGHENKVQASLETLKRLLYAISSATRGNMDVQEALSPSSPLYSESTDLVLVLHNITTSLFPLTLTHTSPMETNSPLPSFPTDPSKVSILRKVWNLVSDMSQEFAFVRHELVEHLNALEGQDGGETKSPQAGNQQQVELLLSSIHPLGQRFLPPPSSASPVINWIHLSGEIVDALSTPCLVLSPKAPDTPPVNSHITSSASTDGVAPNQALLEDRAVPVPVTASYEEGCLALSSPPHRAVYSSAATAYRTLLTLLSSMSAPTSPLIHSISNRRIERNILLMEMHPSMRS
jgi:hypothetical protein